MPGPALQILQQFRAAESNWQHGVLIDLMDDDIIYSDPTLGTHWGKAAVAEYLQMLDRYLPTVVEPSPSWHFEADTSCGWAEWELVGRRPDGKRVVLPGQSLYRLRDGKITYVASYVDTRARRRFRGDDMSPVDHATSLGLSVSPDHPKGRAHGVLQQYWALQHEGRLADLAALFAADSQFVSPVTETVTGRDKIEAFLRRMEVEFPQVGGRVELVDLAGDDTVAWAQWWFRLPQGDVPCWTVYTLRDGEITYVRDMFDLDLARRLAVAPAS